MSDRYWDEYDYDDSDFGAATTAAAIEPTPMSLEVLNIGDQDICAMLNSAKERTLRDLYALSMGGVYASRVGEVYVNSEQLAQGLIRS